MERAILCVPKYEYYANQYKKIKDATAETRSAATKTASEELAEMEKEFRSGTEDAATRGALAAANSLSRKSVMLGNKYNFATFEVQYNPKSISFSSMKGKQISSESSGMGAAAMTNITQNTVPPSVVMSCDLIFDDVSINDAFTEQTITDNPLNGAMQIAANNMTKSMLPGKNGGSYEKYHSVQRYLEGFMGLLLSPFSRQIMFYWSGMCFRGELVAVNGSYTMFNPDGEPVRANINLRIRQNQDIPGSDDQWNTAFNKVFQKGMDLGAASGLSKMTNNKLINLNL